MPKDNIGRKTGELNGKESGVFVVAYAMGMQQFILFKLWQPAPVAFHIEQTDNVRMKN